MQKALSVLMTVLLLLSLITPSSAQGSTLIKAPAVSFEISSPAFPDAYIITEGVPSARSIGNKFGSLGSVTATVFVEETYDMVNGELVVSNSRLLSKEEVLSIGIDNFKSLKDVPKPKRAASSSRGRLTITFSGTYNTSNGVTCNLTGTAHWDGSGIHVEGENYCATGEDYIGVIWSGGFSVKSSSISGTNQLGGALKFCTAESTPNVGRVWSFDDVLRTSRYNLYAEDITLNMSIKKNRLTGGGNTAEAVLKYIHTYSKVNGTISISAGSDSTVAGSITLSNTDKQWSIVCTVTDIPY